MAFTPITANQPISYALSRSSYRNAPREAISGSPVLFTPSSLPVGQYGYNGPRYKEGYTYYNCPYPENTYNGNCTWWCWGRLHETMGTYLPNYGDAYNWYSRYAADGGSVDPNANNIQPGDIIVMEDGGPGHVAFVEQVVGNTVYISQSAYSQRSIWDGMSCLVTTYQKSAIYQGALLDMYKDLDSSYFQTVIGVIHTGESSPGPGPTPSENLEISISPSSYAVTMSATQDYVDFTFSITITGIPAGATVSGGNTYPGLSRVYNTGWSYTNYTVGGTTYQRATKTQTLRYNREHSYAYTTTKHMYFNLSFSTGTVSTDTPMRINVQMKSSLTNILMIAARRRKKGGIINVGKA